jgi:hypothetical protein
MQIDAIITNMCWVEPMRCSSLAIMAWHGMAGADGQVDVEYHASTRSILPDPGFRFAYIDNAGTSGILITAL